MGRKHKVAAKQAARKAAEAKRKAAAAAKRAAHDAKIAQAAEEAAAAEEARQAEVAKCIAIEEAEAEAKAAEEREEMEAKMAAEKEAALVEANKQLLHATRIGDYLKAKEALEKGADVKYSNEDGENALSLAVQSHEVMLVNLIVDAGGDVKQLTKTGDNLLSVALSTYFDESQQTNCAKVICKLEKIYDLDPHHKNNEGRSFADAIRKSDTWVSDLGEVVQEVHRHYQQIIEAAMRQCAEGAAANVTGNLHLLGQLSPKAIMLSAVASGDLNIVQSLAESGYPIKFDIPGAPSLIHIAAEKGCVDIIRYFHQYGVGIESRAEHGGTPLHKAAAGGHVDAIQVLIEFGANVDCRNELGATPVYFAVDADQLDAVKFLIEKCNADISIPYDITISRTGADGTKYLGAFGSSQIGRIAKTQEMKDYLKSVEKGDIKLIGRTEEISDAEDTLSTNEEGAGAGSYLTEESKSPGDSGVGEGNSLVGSRLANYLDNVSEGFNVDVTTPIAGDLPHIDAE